MRKRAAARGCCLQAHIPPKSLLTLKLKFTAFVLQKHNKEKKKQPPPQTNLKKKKTQKSLWKKVGKYAF